MGSILGIVITLVMVFGGYIGEGGKMAIIFHTLPFEVVMIAGAAIGAFVVGSDGTVIKRTLKDLGKALKGTHWKRADYQDLLVLLFELIRITRQNPMDVEAHIEDPAQSSVFGKYPRILADPTTIEMICDTIRAAGMNYDDPHQVEEVLEMQVEAAEHEAMHSAHALQNMADGLPALGIVAAVLGVIKTMGSIDQPPEVLGKMIGGALVGTFLGVFLAYGIVGPLATRIKALNEEDVKFYGMIRQVLVANLHKHSPNICIEVARQNMPRKLRPSFVDLEAALKAARGTPT